MTLEQAENEEERTRNRDWLRALDAAIARDGRASVESLLRQLQRRAAARGIQLPYTLESAYVNTIPPGHQPEFPGDLDLEEKLTNIVRWNAMAMVMRANRRLEGIGGHIATYLSASTLFEVGFNHFFRGKDHDRGGDQLYLQGHSSPGIYARAFLEGRLSREEMDNFRRELQPGGGLSSYPHPWLMPDFWEFPSVSMGLAPVMAIYQARFNRYLENRGLKDDTGRVWAIVGDGEMDEPEAVGALRFAARERLDNLTFIVDCNLQRLDGPVAPNTKIIQELEGVFRGAGWNVVKVLWGQRWDELFEHDVDGFLLARFDELVDGDFQRYAVEGGAFMRDHLFDRPALADLASGLDDSTLEALNRNRGGHDITKMYAALHAAVEEDRRPTVVLAQTIKGLGLGDAGEARNVAHKTKDLDSEQLRHFRDFLDVPVPDDDLDDVPFYRPDDDSDVLRYLRARREELGGYLPDRRVQAPPLKLPEQDLFRGYDEGSGDRPATTTMILVRLLADLIADDELGELIVPIVPDEARTFGLEALFPRAKIYSPLGQQYEPVDADKLLTYAESKEGQILEEGITEAGSMSSAIAAGTAYATHGVNTIPFFFFYSIFGLQRIGDLVWAAGDARTRGFLVGATSGRTTLNGEGLQHIRMATAT